MLRRIDELIVSGQDFSFETTLSSKSFLHTIINAKARGYYVTLIFFWLESVELAKDRVLKRVSEGGHNIEESVIERRYKNGIVNLFNLYERHVDYLLIYDNSNANAQLIAEKELSSEYQIHQMVKFETIKSICNE
jgi:predicted ABC-type ATPase